MCVNPHGQRLGCCSSPRSLMDYKLRFQCFSLILETMILDNVWLNCLFLLPVTLFFIIGKIIKYVNLTKQYNIYKKQYSKPSI